MNPAVTDFAAVISTLHFAAVPVQAPDQQVKVELLAGVAVSVTKARNIGIRAGGATGDAGGSQCHPSVASADHE